MKVNSKKNGKECTTIKLEAMLINKVFTFALEIKLKYIKIFLHIDLY